MENNRHSDNDKNAEKVIHNLERMLDNIRAAAYTIRMDDYHLQFLNRELKNMLPEIQEGKLCYEALWDRDTPCTFCPILKNEGGSLCSHMELFNKKLDRYLSFDVVDITDADGERLALFTAYDVSRLVRSENRLREVAYTDVLTNAKNRTAFLERLSILYERKSSGSICLLNIKFLKRYNVLYGKKHGDELIKKIVSVFTEYMGRDNVYRVDGAKIAFLVVGSAITILRDIVGHVVDKLVRDWDNPNFKIHFDTVFLSFPSSAKTPEELVYNGEYLLRKCGKANSGGVLVFDRNEQTVLNRRNHIEELLRSGDYAGKFQVYYQPIYNIQFKSFSKCEALLRLFDDDLGAVPPLEFISIAEENGHISELGKYVLKEVCTFLFERIKAGLPVVQVNVNVSGIEFARPGFLEDVSDTVSRYEIPPSLIQFELTESIFVNSMDYVVDIMNRMIERGFTFAVDDFGTGYSNLNYIGTMPLSCLKLDKSFMDNLLLSESYQLIITNIIEIAKGLHMNIVAEGIESKDQYDLIKKMGTNFIQGYLFSKPLPKEEYERFLQSI